MLEGLEQCGVLTMPAKRNTIPGPRTPIARTGRSDPRPEIDCARAELEPVSLHSATQERDIADWNELVDRHHGLGCPRPFGRPRPVMTRKARPRRRPAAGRPAGACGSRGRAR